MKIVLRVEEFEDRLVPAVSIDSAYESYAWVLVNSLRADPTAFANNLDGLKTGSVASAFGFAKSDPIITDLKSMISNAAVPAHYGQALSLMRGTAPAGAFGWMELLEDRAGNHNQWMKVNGFEHTTVNSGNRFAIPGFTKNNSAPADTWGYSGEFNSWGENIGYAVGSLSVSKAAFNLGTITLAGLQQRAAFLDTVSYMLELNSGSLGHLQNLLGRDSGTSSSLPEFNAIGLDTDLFEAPSYYEVQDGVAEAYLSTHRLGLFRPTGGGFISGIVFSDRNSNEYYDVGEGLAATVDVRDSSGNGFTDTLAAIQHGAFSGFVGNGVYTVTFTIDGAVVGTQSVTVNNGNAWAAFAGEAIGKPTLTSPTGTQTSLRPTISWTAANAATSYQVRIDDLSAKLTNILNFPSTTSTSYSPTSDLVSGRNYRVWVRGTLGGVTGSWSAPKDFSIGLSKRIGPTSGVADLTPTFAWTAISGARYQIRIDDLSGVKNDLFPNLTLTGTTWEPTEELVSGRNYHWRVRAINTEVRGVWSAWQTFGITKPVLSASIDLNNLRPQLNWSSIAGATAYEVRLNDISANRFNIFPLTSVADTNWTPTSDLVSGRTYSWQVRAVNAAGRGGWSTMANFTIAKPTLSAPFGNISDPSPNFTWSSITGTTTYVINIFDVTLGKRVTLENVSASNWTPPSDLIVGHEYRWWVRATNSLGQGGWSAAAEFRVV